MADCSPCPPSCPRPEIDIAELSRRPDACQPGSRRRSRLNGQIARAYAKATRRSDNWARRTAKTIVEAHRVVVLEQLELKNMTRSARGSVANPGNNVAAKQALNRRRQDAAPGRLAHRICVKAEQAGRRIWLVDPKNSSRCWAACAHTEAANRRTRDRSCCRLCGRQDHADTNAAVIIAARGTTAEAAWQAHGTPLLVRPSPRLRRPTNPASTINQQRGQQDSNGNPGPGRLRSRKAKRTSQFATGPY